MTLKRYEVTVKYELSNRGFIASEWKREGTEFAHIDTNPQLKTQLEIEMDLYRDNLGYVNESTMIKMGYESQEDGTFFGKVIQLEDI